MKRLLSLPLLIAAFAFPTVFAHANVGVQCLFQVDATPTKLSKLYESNGFIIRIASINGFTAELYERDGELTGIVTNLNHTDPYTYNRIPFTKKIADMGAAGEDLIRRTVAGHQIRVNCQKYEK